MIRKVVIDTNQLRTLRLRDYLAKSKSNFAVLPDYASIEAYKGDTLITIQNSMRILSEFPSQVIILKSTNLICGLKGRLAGLQKRMTDYDQSKNFVTYSTQLKKASRGDQHYQKQLSELGIQAHTHVDRILEGAKIIVSDGIREIAALYSKDELRTIRSDTKYPPQLIEKICKHVIQLAEVRFTNNPHVRNIPSYKELPYTFLFRQSLCMFLLVLNWAANGGTKPVKKVANDMVDMNFVTFGTFFDGLMTSETEVRQIHYLARLWLVYLFKCEVPGGICGEFVRP